MTKFYLTFHALRGTINNPITNITKLATIMEQLSTQIEQLAKRLIDEGRRMTLLLLIEQLKK